MFHYTLINHPENFSLKEVNIDMIFLWVETEVPLVQKGVLNIAFLSDEEMKSLNMQYRWLDSTTDVLSFHYFDDFHELRADEVAGEIILSESRILSQAKEHAHTPEKETEILILHGILHILWFDHENDTDYAEMWKHEKSLRRKIDTKNKISLF